MCKLVERETVINWNAGEDEAWVSTRMSTVKKLMKKYGVKLYRTQADYECYLVPKSWIHIRPPAKRSVKQRQAASESMRKRHKKIGDGRE